MIRNCTQVLATTVLGIASLSLLPATACAQDEALTYKGPVACVDCHERPNALRATDFVMLNESVTWLRQEQEAEQPRASLATADKHFLAYELLQGEIGKRMGQALYGNPDVTQRAECLSCHAGAPKSAEAMIPFGVSCESCHGPSSEYEGPHDEVATWRAKTPEDKLKLGLIDLRDTEARARQCFSCHIGNAEQGRVVTHAMYAAGHPPLPSVELETFANQMPRHWRSLAEKGNFTKRAEWLKANRPHMEVTDTPDLPRTRGVIISGVVALQHALELNAHLIEHQGDAGKGYEFAAFECNACHHDLKPASWRQLRGYPHGRPGRPPMHQWPAALVPLGIQQAVGNDPAKYASAYAKYQELLANVEAAYVAQPFGDSKAVGPATTELHSFLNIMLSKLKTSRYDQAANSRALSRLEQLAATGYHDFQSARQLAWATKMLLVESRVEYPQLWRLEPPGRNKGRDDVAAFEQWIETQWKPAAEKTEAEFSKAGRFSDYLQLNLPAGQAYKIEEYLPPSLEAMRLYDPNEFRVRYEQLGEG